MRNRRGTESDLSPAHAQSCLPQRGEAEAPKALRVGGALAKKEGADAKHTTRRKFLTATGGLAAGGTAALLSPRALSQSPTPDLTRIQSARRILLKAGIFLSLHLSVRDFH